MSVCRRAHQKFIIGALTLFTFHLHAKVQLAPPLILDPPLNNSTLNSRAQSSSDAVSFNADSLLKSIESAVSPSHPEMYSRWQKYLKAQNLDIENEDKTLIRLQKQYLDSIHNWGEQVSECDSTRSSGRWLRRLRLKHSETEIKFHKKDIAKIITSLYLKRKNECMQSHEDLALRAERQLNLFTLERTRMLIDFISQNSEVRISETNKIRLLSTLKRKQNAHTLSERTVDLNALRLETRLQNLPQTYVEFLSHEQSFKKPFDLHKNLTLLSSEYAETPQLKKAKGPKKKEIDLNLTKTTS
jgi:hypothetical protein